MNKLKLVDDSTVFAQGMTVYHSSVAHNAVDIVQGGFALDKSEYGFGSAKGRGIYCAPTVKGTAPWFTYGIADMITLKCRLRPGLRIAWIEKEYDKKLTAQLKREFGKGILHSPSTFQQALPANKQLTKDELLALLGYFFLERCDITSMDRRKVWLRTRENWWRRHFPHLRKQLSLHGFGAIGDRSEAAWDTEEIVVFNPADIHPVSAHRLDISKCGFLSHDEEENFGNAILLPPLSESELRYWQQKSQRSIREIEAA